MIYTNENWEPPVTYCEPNKSEETMEPTEKQINFIRDIQEWTGKQFTGTTKKELSETDIVKEFENVFQDRRAISLDEIKSTIRGLFE